MGFCCFYSFKFWPWIPGTRKGRALVKERRQSMAFFVYGGRSMSECRVNVFDEDGNVIGRVRYNADLDFWDGRNWTCGSTGRHQGIAKLKDCRYVLIHGTQWQGERDTAELVTAEEALQAILKSGHDDLLETKKFKDLEKLHAETMAEEADDLEEEL